MLDIPLASGTGHCMEDQEIGEEDLSWRIYGGGGGAGLYVSLRLINI